MRTPSSPRPSSRPASPTHPLAPYGWDAQVADAFAPYADEGLVPARVVRVDRGRCEAVTADGPVHADTASVGGPDPLRLACTGDWAVLAPSGAGGWQVRALLPRRTALLRSTSTKSSHGQVLAANLDLAVIAVSLAADPALARVERFVSLAWASGAQPVVALTKSDLAPDAGHIRADVASVAPGVRVVVVSALTGQGVAELAEVLDGATSVLLGVSGAGKSTLANVLLGGAAQRVHAVRDSDGRGRHTTTTRDLLPLPGGGVLIDTPGLRGVGLWGAEEGLSRTFVDVEELAARCRFGDCAHESEPGCAVRAALADGTLAERRLASYRKLRRENRYLAARTDARLRAEQRRESKRRDATDRFHAALKQGRPDRRRPAPDD